jgi:hypothetical protein
MCRGEVGLIWIRSGESGVANRTKQGVQVAELTLPSLTHRQNGVSTHLGMTVRDFQNFFMMYGPQGE